MRVTIGDPFEECACAPCANAPSLGPATRDKKLNCYSHAPRVVDTATRLVPGEDIFEGS